MSINEKDVKLVEFGYKSIVIGKYEDEMFCVVDFENIMKFYRQQILALLKEYGEEIIGKDDEKSILSFGAPIIVREAHLQWIKNRSDLRQEQRKKATILQNKMKDLQI